MIYADVISLDREDIIGWGTVATIVLTIIGAFLKWVVPPLRNISQMAHDFVGRDARPGFDREPGVMERLRNVEIAANDASYNSKPNGGNSAYDHLMKQAQADKRELQADIASIIDVVSTHIRDSEADRSGLHREVNLLKIDRSEHHNDSPAQ